MSFGAFVKQKRIEQQKTLRQFCKENGLDPSNWSKIERGINPPPKDGEKLSTWGVCLGLEPDSDEWQRFMDEADVSRGNIPQDVIENEQLIEKLPIFFRTVRGAELSDEKIDDLIEDLRKAYSPDE